MKKCVLYYTSIFCFVWNRYNVLSTFDSRQADGIEAPMYSSFSWIHCFDTKWARKHLAFINFGHCRKLKFGDLVGQRKVFSIFTTRPQTNQIFGIATEWQHLIIFRKLEHDMLKRNPSNKTSSTPQPCTEKGYWAFDFLFSKHHTFYVHEFGSKEDVLHIYGVSRILNVYPTLKIWELLVLSVRVEFSYLSKIILSCNFTP